MDFGKTNGEIGKIWTAFILGELFEAWPRRCDFNALDVGAKTGEEPRSEPEEFFDDLISWLADNGLIRTSERTDGAAYSVALTEKGFGVLGTNAPGSDRSLGTKLKEAAISAGTDAGRSLLSSLIKAVVGAGIAAITNT